MDSFILTSLAISAMISLITISSAQPEPPELCTASVCKLPNCLCAGYHNPGGFEPVNTPQTILFTFSGQVTAGVTKSLTEVFMGQTNPNGCQMGVTVYVSHIDTDYCQVAELWTQGHEIASNGITVGQTREYWEKLRHQEYDVEADGQRSLITALAGIPLSDIRGYRAPLFQPGGDTQYSVQTDRGFLFDSTILVNEDPANRPFWPFTMDFPYQVTCISGACPQEGYPGLWQLLTQPPTIDIMQEGNITKSIFCEFLDDCTKGLSEEEILAFLKTHFERNYNSNRAPLNFNMRTIAFIDNENFKSAFTKFLEDLLALDDVWLITASHTIEWLKNPVDLTEINNFEPWTCSQTRKKPRCSNRVLTGMNRTRKAGFEFQEQNNITEYFGVRKGGTTLLAVYLLVFIVAFLYIVATE